jgi:hypothetical protein
LIKRFSTYQKGCEWKYDILILSAPTSIFHQYIFLIVSIDAISVQKYNCCTRILFIIFSGLKIVKRVKLPISVLLLLILIPLRVSVLDLSIFKGFTYLCNCICCLHLLSCLLSSSVTQIYFPPLILPISVYCKCKPLVTMCYRKGYASNCK